MFSTRFEVDDALDALETAIVEAVDRATVACGLYVVDVARREHAFTNRTGLLEAHIEASDHPVMTLRGLVRVEVYGNTDYGGFVEERWGGKRAYLLPAYTKSEEALNAILDRGLFYAVNVSTRYGWRTAA